MKGQNILKADLERGVMHIKDKNYNPWCNGVTKYSLIFFNHIMKNHGEKVGKVISAELKYDMKNHHRLYLKTENGYELSFYGCSSGYYGEGSRGSADILERCGFTEKQIQRVFKKENFKVFKRIA
jgi:hypothetical protein